MLRLMLIAAIAVGKSRVGPPHAHEISLFVSEIHENKYILLVFF